MSCSPRPTPDQARAIVAAVLRHQLANPLAVPLPFRGPNAQRLPALEPEPPRPRNRRR